MWIIFMDLSRKIIQLRKEKRLTQQSMADAIGIHITQIKRYESGGSQPSIDAIKKIAITFNVTTDSLLFDETERNPNNDLKLRFEAIAQLPNKEQKILKELLDGMILKYKTQQWLS